MKKFILLMMICNGILAWWGWHSIIVPYQNDIAVLNHALKHEDLRLKSWQEEWKEKEKRLRKEIFERDTLVMTLQKDLALFYTFQKAGITADSIDTVRELAELASNLPFGSPFRDGHVVTSNFGVRDERWFGGDGVHEGIDIVPLGTWEIRATADGKIVDFNEDETYGKWILYETEGGHQILYAHLSKIYWQEGTLVKNIPLTKGTRIARMGNTGLTSGPHLHMEIRIRNNSGEFVNLDPEAIINYIGD